MSFLNINKEQTNNDIAYFKWVSEHHNYILQIYRVIIALPCIAIK
jgi:hypothetical protein